MTIKSPTVAVKCNKKALFQQKNLWEAQKSSKNGPNYINPKFPHKF